MFLLIDVFGGIMTDPLVPGITRTFIESNWVSTGIGKREKIQVIEEKSGKVGQETIEFKVRVLSQNLFQKKMQDWFNVEWSTQGKEKVFQKGGGTKEFEAFLKNEVDSLGTARQVRQFKELASDDHSLHEAFENRTSYLRGVAATATDNPRIQQREEFEKLNKFEKFLANPRKLPTVTADDSLTQAQAKFKELRGAIQELAEKRFISDKDKIAGLKDIKIKELEFLNKALDKKLTAMRTMENRDMEMENIIQGFKPNIELQIRFLESGVFLKNDLQKDNLLNMLIKEAISIIDTPFKKPPVT